MVGSTNTPPMEPKIQLPSNFGHAGSISKIGTPAGFWARIGRTMWPPANATTTVGALCFLAGGLMLLLEAAKGEAST